MEKLYDYLAGDEWVIIITTIISLYAAIVALFMIYIKSKRHYRKSKREEVYNLIKKGIEEESFDNDGDIFLVYKRLAQGDYHYNSYADFLESFLIYIRNKDGEWESATHFAYSNIRQANNLEKMYVNGLFDIYNT